MGFVVNVLMIFLVVIIIVGTRGTKAHWVNPLLILFCLKVVGNNFFL